MSKWQTLRREYGEQGLSIHTALADPIAQFNQWFDEVAQAGQMDISAMVLSTVDSAGWPDARVVLLKGIEEESFIFYTHYRSAKGGQLAHNPHACLTFYWSSLARQVRIRGTVEQLSGEESDKYFATRPRMSQLSAWASLQSHTLDRGRAELEEQVTTLEKKYANKEIPRPDAWGGYRVIAVYIEFWQGRSNRLHDRIRYCKKHATWEREYLAP